jgi:arsenate reductase-like glutaredoxin family protein
VARPVAYVSATSGECQALLDFARRNKVDLDVRDVSAPGVKAALYSRYKVLVIPVIEAGGRAYYGYEANRAEVEAALLASRL